MRGPGLQNADLMIAKMFRLSDRAGMELRGEVFNASNTPPLNDPNGSFGSAAFGSIDVGGESRSVRVGRESELLARQLLSAPG